jgi:hypothetical protein
LDPGSILSLVDYLIYTGIDEQYEESYPLVPLFEGIALASLFVFFVIRKWLDASINFAVWGKGETGVDLPRTPAGPSARH